MTPLKSSLIASADYDEASKTLTLNFHSGAHYSYNDVPRETYHDLTKAESAGQFFQKTIRSHFQSVKVEK